MGVLKLGILRGGVVQPNVLEVNYWRGLREESAN